MRYALQRVWRKLDEIAPRTASYFLSALTPEQLTLSHVTQVTTWCIIDIDTTNGRVVLLEQWPYVWLLQSPRMTRWTLQEKPRFHARADRAIWAAWSNRAHLKVEGTSDFATRFTSRAIPVFTDIRWVLAKPHWTVKVTKVPPNQIVRSVVFWKSREIHLDSNDFSTRETCFGPPKNACANQVPVTHEFGHTIGNMATFHRDRDDEYEASSPFVDDIHSIMHRGNQLRERHFDHLLTELYELLPNTVFAMDPCNDSASASAPPLRPAGRLQQDRRSSMRVRLAR